MEQNFDDGATVEMKSPMDSRSQDIKIIDQNMNEQSDPYIGRQQYHQRNAGILEHINIQSKTVANTNDEEFHSRNQRNQMISKHQSLNNSQQSSGNKIDYKTKLRKQFQGIYNDPKSLHTSQYSHQHAINMFNPSLQQSLQTKEGFGLSQISNSQMRDSQQNYYLKNSFVSQSIPRPTSDLVKKKKKHQTKININLPAQAESLHDSLQGLDKIEKNLKIIDSLLTNEPQSYQIKQYTKHQHIQLRESIQKIKEAENLNKFINFRRSSNNFDLNLEEDQVEFRDSIKEREKRNYTTLKNHTHHRLIPLTNSSIVHQAELLYGKGRKDSLAIQSVGIGENLSLKESLQGAKTTVQGMKGNKRRFHLEKNQKMKELLQEDQDSKKKPSDIEIVLQLKKKRPKSDYRRKHGESSAHNQQPAEIKRNQSKKKIGEEHTNGFQNNKSQSSLRQGSQVHSQYYQYTDYNNQSAHNKTFDNYSINYNSHKDNQEYNNIVIKINNLNTSQQPSFQIIGNNNFAKIFVNPVIVNQPQKAAQLKNRKIQNMRVTQHKIQPKQENFGQQTNTSFFNGSDMMSVHSSIFQDRTSVPYITATGGQGFKTFQKGSFNQTPINEKKIGKFQNMSINKQLSNTKFGPSKSQIEEYADTQKKTSKPQSIIENIYNEDLSNKQYSSFNIAYSQPSDYQNAYRRQNSQYHTHNNSIIDKSQLESRAKHNSAYQSVVIEPSINEEDMMKLLSKRNYIKLKRQTYSTKDDPNQYKNRNYIQSLEIKERVAASKNNRQRSKDKMNHYYLSQ